MFSDAGPDIRWVGNESGMGSTTNWCHLNKDEMYPGGNFAKILGAGHENGSYWVPAEVDVSIRPGWFWHEKQDSLVRSPENLMELYYSSIGRNSNLLLNVPPDKRGLLNEKDVASLIAFRDLREKEFANELAKGRKASASDVRGKGYVASNVNDGDPGTFWTTGDDHTTGELVIDLSPGTEVNRIVLQEYIKLGQRVQEFRVDAFSEGEWKPLLEGTTIGHKVIREFPVINASQIRVSITKSKACPVISNIELYRAPGD
jgi:alpha-L-fucosidase